MQPPRIFAEPVTSDDLTRGNEDGTVSEETSLLVHKNAIHNRRTSSPDSSLAVMHLEDTIGTYRLILIEFAVLVKSAVPVMLAYLLQASFQLGSIWIVGRASSEDLSTASFSYNFATCTGWVIVVGGSTALDTLASSSFTGSTNKHDIGVLLQRALLVLTLFYIPIAVLWFFSRPLFLFLGQTDRIATDSARFLTNLIPGGLGFIYFETMKKYLQAQGIMRPGTYVLIITSPISALLNYLFVYVAGWGVFAAPFANGIAYWLSFIGLVLYSRFVAGSECWGGWSKRCFENLGIFMRFAILGIVQVGAEWWAFEVIAIMAGQLGKIPLAAQSILTAADAFFNNIGLGLGIATSARVGNMLGARNAKGARRAANTSALFSICCGMITLTILMGTRNRFASIFTDDQAIIQLTSRVLPYVAFLEMASGLNGSCGGSLRGMGRQNIGATAAFVSYYCLALPLGVYLAFHTWGLGGLWAGQCSGLYLVTLGQWGFIVFSKWNREVERAFERLDDDPQI